MANTTGNSPNTLIIFNWRWMDDPEAGGAEVHLYHICKKLSERGYSIVAVCGKSKSRSSTNDQVIEVHRVGSKYTFAFFAPLYYLLKLHKRQGIILEDISKMPLFSTLWAPTKKKIAIIHHIHGQTLFSVLPKVVAFLLLLMEKTIPLFYSRTKTVVVSESTKKELVQMGFSPENISVIPNGLEENFLNSIKDYTLKKTEYPLIIYFGRIARYKRIEHVLHAFKEVTSTHPSAHLTVAGKGDLKYFTELKNLSKKIRIKNTEFIYNLTREQKINLLSRAWVSVITSMKEGFGISVLEANACGTPCVGYDVPGLRCSITSGVNGILIPDGDISELSNALLSLINSQQLLAKLEERSREHAEKFCWDDAANVFSKIIKEQMRSTQAC